jgi:diguanylate cyclase (GGDEF)-like protein
MGIDLPGTSAAPTGPREVPSLWPEASSDRGDVGPETARWRPRVRLVLALVIMLPFLATGILIASSAVSEWKTRAAAQVTARDADQLRAVASARAEMNALEVPMDAISYAGQLGITEAQLDALLHPSVPLRVQLAQVTSHITGYPTFSSTPALRADVRQLPVLISKVAAGGVPYATVQAFNNKMAADIDNVWYGDYDQLQKDIAAWQPPGAFEVHAAALRQTYQAFLAGGHEIEGGIYVLEGVGPSGAKQELIQAAGVYQAASSQFVGHLSPKAQQAWDQLQASPADRHFAATIQQALTVALNNLRPPFLGDLTFAGTSFAPSLHYLGDLNRLVTSASTDLHDTAVAQAHAATVRLIVELIFLSLLALISVGGVIIAGRALTRPLNKLADAAHRIRSGDFDTDRLDVEGPQEIAATTEAFNEMASTLKAVETKAMALAAEDLASPDLVTPLPGRTGHALQSSVDLLSNRIREREIQRQLLQEAANHDGLTGLLNRAAVLEFLDQDVSRRREAGETVAVLFVDLDALKPLNDAYGHQVGDEAIRSTAMALVAATEPCDVVGRLGGDEFLVVLCHQHSCESSAVVERIRQSIGQRTISTGGATLALEASVGIALAQCDSDTDPMVLVRQADEAMYEAKKAARASRERLQLG